MSKLRVLDLFSGIGGFSLGLERTGGFETVAFCEIDPFCQKVLKKHWPDVPIYEDVRTLNYDGPVDVITGGYPCQPFSTAGKRQGANDDRHLWPAMFSLIQKHWPAWVIGENVAGHISMGLDQVLSDLESENYRARAFVIPACAVDAPHRRDRVWIVAYAQGGDDRRNAREFQGQDEQQETIGQKKRIPEFASANESTFTNARSERIQGVLKKALCGKRAFSWCENLRGPQDYRGRSDIPEPLLCGNDDGVSPRLHAIGNAVVPQIPEIIGHAILQAEAA